MEDKTLKYYSITFKGQNYKGSIMLMEDKELDENEYHKNKKYGLSFYYYIDKVRAYVKIVNPHVEKVNFETYEFKCKNYRVCNEEKIDGFRYDAKNKKILYGYTNVYAIKKNGNFYDVITGKLIPRNIILVSSVLGSHEEFAEMIDDLEFIKKHKKLYEEIICNIIELLSIGQRNIEKAKKEYKKRCLLYEQKKLKEMSLNAIDETDLEKSKKIEEAQKVEEDKEKIKCLLNDIKFQNY